MKFSWFHLMPWRWLPQDFRQRYHSVWVDVPNALYDPVRGHRLYNEYLDMLEYADQVGFDAVGVNEHHQNAYGMMPSPNIMAAALARRCPRAMLLVRSYGHRIPRHPSASTPPGTGAPSSYGCRVKTNDPRSR